MQMTNQISCAPALARDGENRIWMAWKAFDPREGRTAIYTRYHHRGVWSPEKEIVSSSDDVLQPVMTQGPKGEVWLFWTEQRNGVWNTYLRQLTPTTESDEVNLSDHRATDFAPTVATDTAGRVWLAWQSKRSGNLDVFVRHYAEEKWSPPLCLTDNGSSNWSPAITADAHGGVWVAWDSYRNGNYDIYLRHVREGPSLLSNPIRVTTSRSYDMDVSIAADGEDGVWIAWRRTVPWGRDSYRLNTDGQLCLRRYDNRQGLFGLPAEANYTYHGRSDDYGVVPVPVDLLRRELPVLPTVIVDRNGAVHLFYRRFRDHGWRNLGWNVEHLIYSGDSWSEIETLSSEPGDASEKIAVTEDEEGSLWVGFQSCPCEDTYKPIDNPESRVYMKKLHLLKDETKKAVCDTRPGSAHVPAPPTDIEELHYRRLERRTKREQFLLLWGDLHRHTIYSPCVPEGDGSLLDNYRWAYDAGGLDFYATADHVDCLNRYTWEQTMVYADLFYSKGDLSPIYSFETTYKDGRQANYYYIDRSIGGIVRKAGLDKHMAEAWEIFDQAGLSGKVIVARHYHGSPGRGNGKDWNGKYEPLMEVVQTRGFAFGVMESLLSSGIKIGVVGGCDHSRPPGGVMPWKYPNALTGLWAKAVSREEIFAAMQQRRSYATSGKKIGLIFQMDDHLMGEEYDTDGSPNLHIEAKGTTEIEKIEVIRDGEVILLQTDCGQHALANYKDETAKPGEHYYYVVITQREEAGDNYKGIAVTSPIWVNKLA